MKKKLIPLLLLLALLLTGCGKDKTASGTVTAVLGDGVIVRLPEGTETAFLLGEDTITFSWVESVSWEDLEPGMNISADYSGWKKTYTAPDGREYPGYTAKILMIEEVRADEPVILSDGTEVWPWQGMVLDPYRLADGTELLCLNDLPMEAPGEAVSQEAGEKIQAYFDAQGILYDPISLLEQAWEAHQNTQPGENFQSFYASQMVSQTAVSDRVVYYGTSLILPFDSQEGSMTRLGAAFDRETGDVIPLEDLFTCPPEEIPGAVLEACAISEGTLRREMEAAFLPEYVVFGSDGNVEVTFPKGTLASQEYVHIVTAELEKLEGILQPWAVPEIQE